MKVSKRLSERDRKTGDAFIRKRSVCVCIVYVFLIYSLLYSVATLSLLFYTPLHPITFLKATKMKIQKKTRFT